MAVDDLEELTAGLLVERTSQQRLGVALDGGDRRAELVAHVGHEVAAHHEQPPQPRHVPQHHHHATAARRERSHVERDGSRSRLQLRLGRLAGACRRRDAIAELGIGHGFEL